jgi:hypothetical protein
MYAVCKMMAGFPITINSLSGNGVVNVGGAFSISPLTVSKTVYGSGEREGNTDVIMFSLHFDQSIESLKIEMYWIDSFAGPQSFRKRGCQCRRCVFDKSFNRIKNRLRLRWGKYKRIRLLPAGKGGKYGCHNVFVTF